MLVRDLNGRVYNLSLTKNAVNNKRVKSQLHLRAKELLQQKYPTYPIYEDFPIRVTQYKTLYLDMFIPQLQLIVEVNGEQHFKFNTKFHATPQQFLLQQQNDKLKREWCDLNCFNLIDLNYDKEKEWATMLGLTQSS